ncbi:MAG: AAA family ATPase, partial [Halobacteriovoraceae bacterium]|nr:AAA family ATPase [Halobacteriovoraceae bacterium]
MQSLKLSKLQVTNFRNLEKEVIQFGPGINCILGENGNGKTNILEAVHVLITRKSFRKNSSFPQFLSIDGDIPEIYFSSVFDGPEGSPFSFTGKWDSDRHEWYCDGRPTRKKPEVAVLFINPFDSYSFHNTASMRRTWFDQHIGVLNPEYKKVLNKYNTALRFRNALLSKKPSHFLEQIKAMDPELAKYSKILTDSRKAFLLEIQSYCSGAFKEIFSEEHLLEIQLDSKVSGWSESQIYDLLQSNLQKDTLIGHTRYGVHKDDYTLLFDGLNSFDFCSLGQQKMSYLSLLFA